MAKKQTRKRRGEGNVTPGGNYTQLFVDLIDAGNAQAQLILKAIAQHADWKTGECFPKANTLAEIAKCSTKTVRRYLHKMEGDGLITLAPRYEDDDDESGRQTSNLITLKGYAEWAAVIRAGGLVAAPVTVKKYDGPPGQDDQGTPGPVDQGPPGQGDQGAEPEVGPELSRGPGQQVSTPPGQQVSTHELHLNPQLNLTPPTPRRRGARARDDLLEEVRSAKPLCGRAMDKLFTPLLTRIRFDAPLKANALGTLVEWAEKQTDEVLEETLQLLTTPDGEHYRSFNVRPTNIEVAMKAAIALRKARAAVRNSPYLYRGTPEFATAIAQIAESHPQQAEWFRSREFFKRDEVARYGALAGARQEAGR